MTTPNTRILIALDVRTNPLSLLALSAMSETISNAVKDTIEETVGAALAVGGETELEANYGFAIGRYKDGIEPIRVDELMGIEARHLEVRHDPLGSMSRLVERLRGGPKKAATEIDEIEELLRDLPNRKPRTFTHVDEKAPPIAGSDLTEPGKNQRMSFSEVMAVPLAAAVASFIYDTMRPTLTLARVEELTVDFMREWYWAGGKHYINYALTPAGTHKNGGSGFPLYDSFRRFWEKTFPDFAHESEQIADRFWSHWQGRSLQPGRA